MLNQKSVLITGGTGFLGRSVIRLILTRYANVKRLIVFSRDELKQYKMKQELSTDVYPEVRYILGDIRDRERLQQVCSNVDYVVHAAALKQVAMAEQNPTEYIKTNILGTENVINAALAGGVERVVVLSTDKAVAPVGLYGATKLCAEKLSIAANAEHEPHRTKISVVRFGNIFGSSGSVLPYFLKKKEEGTIPITDERMTRFSISPSEAADMVLWTLDHMWGGEIYVPKLPSYRVIALAEAIAPGHPVKLVGVRPGEKIHEELIAETESTMTYDVGKYYAILPTQPAWDSAVYVQQLGGKLVPAGFRYASNTNPDYLSPKQLTSLLNEA